ncbi:hypothetical protein IMSAGC014_00554 [Bacteroidaceae bacterium]|nr:hypothetical protein IMSAGC014_00554 [Bacteroidaceae bacterium]
MANGTPAATQLAAYVDNKFFPFYCGLIVFLIIIPRYRR